MNLLLLYLQHLSQNLKKCSLSAGEAIKQAYGKPDRSKIIFEFKEEHMTKTFDNTYLCEGSKLLEKEVDPWLWL